MLKGIFLNIFLSLVFLKTFGQISTEKNHASKMLVVHNTDGSTKGWFPCDFYIEFSSDSKELKTISLNAKDKSLKAVIKRNEKDKFNYQSYKKEDIEYRVYDAIDDLTGEDIKILVGYHNSKNQFKPVSVTLIFMLSSNYITLD